MPPKIGSTGRAHTRLPKQTGISANDQSTPPTPQERSVTPQSSGQPSHAQQKKGGANRMKLLKKQNEQDLILAYEWFAQFKQYNESLMQVYSDMEECGEQAWKALELHHLAKAKILPPQKNDERLEKFAIECLDKAIKQWSNALSVFDNSMIEGESTISLATATLKRFDSLSNKNRLCDLDSNLKKAANVIRATLVQCGVRKAAHSVTFINWSSQRVRDYDYFPMGVEYEALMKEMNSRRSSSKVQGRVKELIKKFDKVSEKYMALVVRGNENIGACDSLLADPYLPRDSKVKIKQSQEQTRFLNSLALLCRIDVENSKTCLLASFVTHKNRERQGDEALKQWGLELWRRSISRLLEQDLNSVLNLMIKLCNDEEDEQSEPGKLSQDELEIRRQAATEGPDKFGKIIEAIKKHAAKYAEYAELIGIEKDERLLPAMNALAETAAEFVRSREYADSMWSGRIQNVEAKVRDEEAKVRDEEERKTEWVSFLPQGSSVQQDFHRTMGGVVIGHINRNGELEEQHKGGKTISTYFKDQDSGNWVKDYGDEAEPSVTGESETRSEKTDVLLHKADNFVKSWMQTAKNNLDLADASPDYYDKANFLHRAFSARLKAIQRVNILVAELKPTQAEDRAASLKTQAERLREDNKELFVRLQRTKQDGQIHAMKRRDPTEGNFRSLQKQEQVASILKEFERRQNRSHGADWLDRYAINFKPGPQGEQYEPWIVHAHYDSNAPDAVPVRVHMKRNAEKDWGVDQPAYHSLQLGDGTFKLVEQEAQKQKALSARKGKSKALS